MRKALSIVLFLVMATMSHQALAALVVTETNVGATLVSSIVGTGITVVPGSVVYSGFATASGTFTGGSSAGITIPTGILLTSGKAGAAVGPNNSDSFTQSNGTGGDADLASLIPGFGINDATKLEFDFTTAGGDLFFSYVFASEEYNEYTNTSYNDVFGFFLDGVNIALIPGTTTPVSINNVNGGNPFGSGASNPTLFNNNDLQNGGPFFDIQYDGFTDVFQAQKLGLSPGIHHIKLAIADAGDSSLDSGVFIQGGSFSDTPTNPIPEPGTMMLLGSGLAGLASYGRNRFKK